MSGRYVWVRMLIVALAFALPHVSFAKDTFGPIVDAYCSKLGRGTPYADLVDGTYFHECTLCHNSSFPTSLPGSGNVKSAPGNAYLSGNYDYFCPAPLNQLPVLSPIGPRAGSVGQMLLIDVSATDADNDPLTLSVTGVPATASFVDHKNGTGSFTWTPAAADVGSHTVTFLVDDGAGGKASEKVTITVDSSNHPPTLSPIDPQKVDPGVLLSFTVSAQDQDNDTIQLTAAPLPAGASFVDNTDGTGSFEWMPASDQVGNFTVTFTATDSGQPPATGTAMVTITVGNVNVAPVLDPIGNRIVKDGEALHVDLSAHDPDGNNLTLMAPTLPAGAELSDNGDGTGAIDWTPATSDVGSHPATAEVMDDGTPPESASESFTITVQAAPVPTDLVIDAASWKDRGKRLLVTGSGAPPGEMVGVLDPASGLLLGSKPARSDGSFRLRLRPFLAPCEVQVQVGDMRSEALRVEGAPATCGQEFLTRAKSDFGCALGELRLKGRRAPAGAEVGLEDPRSDQVLGTSQANARGKFKFVEQMLSPPSELRVRVKTGTHEWLVEPVEVEDCKE